jgi:pimeloyl-ACP methyl ester carboxylesterase
MRISDTEQDTPPAHCRLHREAGRANSELVSGTSRDRMRQPFPFTFDRQNQATEGLHVMRGLLLTLLVVLSLVVPLGGTSTAAQTPVASLEWTPCPPVVDPMATPAVAVDERLECASIRVPLDYDDPTGEQITIGMNRLPARDPANRIGSLIFNPGGPGGPGSALVAAQASGIPVFTPAVLDHFDVIGMDPRGTGTSSHVKCDPDVWNVYHSRFPRNEAEFDELRAYTTAVGESCLELTGPLLGHLDTVSAAKDIEQVRLALGGEPLNYLGLSYGTQLGATYADLYPENIRVMALDGALDHGQRGLAMLDNEARAHERELLRFAEWCDETEECVLHGQDVLAVYDELTTGADEQPIPAPRCAELGYCRPEATGEDIRFMVQGMLMFKDPTPAFGFPGWVGLSQALADAQAGDASAFASYIALTDDSGLFSGLGIECVDWYTDIETWEDMQALQDFAGFIAPHTRGATQTWTILVGCMGWPVPVANPPGEWHVEGAPPILITNAIYDPSTAYVWSQLMREQIDSAVLVTRIGDGHTSYLLQGESATRDAIDHYLLTGETPPPNTIFND